MPYKNIVDKRASDKAYWRKIKGAGPPATQLPIGTVLDLGIRVPKQGLKIALVPDVQGYLHETVKHRRVPK